MCIQKIKKMKDILLFDNLRSKRNPKKRKSNNFLLRHVAIFITCFFCTAIFSTASADDPYASDPQYTKYKSEVKYTGKPTYTTTSLENLINRFTHYLFDTFIPDGYGLPPGYVVVKNDSTLGLGPKIKINKWDDLLDQYWVLLICVTFLLGLVIIMPFIAVCYCCLCCCRCNKEGCPTCDIEKNTRKRCILGYVLVFLISGLIFGVAVCLASNHKLERGLDQTSAEINWATTDTCKYLRDVQDHIRHLFINNYDELCAQLISDIKNNVGDTMYLNLMSRGKLRFLPDLIESVENLEQSIIQMNAVTGLIKDLRFYGSQLRDGLRSLKKDLNYILTVLCGNSECMRFLKMSQIETIDNSKCLHFDEMPDPAKYAKAMQWTANSNGHLTVKSFWANLTYCFKRYMARYVEKVQNFLIDDLNAGKEKFRSIADTTRAIIDSVISDIHLKSRKATNSFEDVVTKFGDARSVVTITLCLILSFIVLFLVIGLIFGCCGKHRTGNKHGFCNKGVGSIFLLMAILLIFCIFSFIVLVGIFYLVIGVLTYQGACAPLREHQVNAIFRFLDAGIDFNQYRPKSSLNPTTPPLRMSNIIRAFQANQSMFDFLDANGLYDIDEISSIHIVKEHDWPQGQMFPEDYTQTKMRLGVKPGVPEGWKSLEKNTDLNEFNSTKFTSILCKELMPLDIQKLADNLMVLRSTLWTQWGIYDWARIALQYEAENLRSWQNEFADKILWTMDEIIRRLSKVDELLKLNISTTFGSFVKDIEQNVDDREDWVWKNFEIIYRDERNKLPIPVRVYVSKYIEMVKIECRTKVGINAPIAGIYNRGVDIVCDRLINPLNMFWVGVLLSSLLLIPVLYVAHQLMCLYNTIKPSPEIEDVGCPECMGEPQRPPLIAKSVVSDSDNCFCNADTPMQPTIQTDPTFASSNSKPKIE